MGNARGRLPVRKENETGIQRSDGKGVRLPLRERKKSLEEWFSPVATVKLSGRRGLSLINLYEMAQEEGVDLFIDLLPKTDSVNIKVFKGEHSFGKVIFLSEIQKSRGEILIEAFNLCVRRVSYGRDRVCCAGDGGY